MRQSYSNFVPLQRSYKSFTNSAKTRLQDYLNPLIPKAYLAAIRKFGITREKIKFALEQDINGTGKSTVSLSLAVYGLCGQSYAGRFDQRKKTRYPV